MAYSTIADLRQRLTETELIQLTDLDGNGTINTEVVTHAIERADSEINSYCQRRYAVPIASPPDVLRQKSVNLAIYYLLLDRRSVDEDARHQHDLDLQWLRDLAKGVVELDVEPPPAASTPGAAAKHEADDRAFGRDRMKW